jgi:hypothetical protein
MPLPLLAAIGLPLAGMIGGALAGRSRTDRQTSTTTPSFDPAFLPLRDRLISDVMGRLRNPEQLSKLVENQRLQSTNQVFDTGMQGLMARLAERGLKGPIEGAGIANMETGRMGALAGVLGETPLINRQFQQEDFSNALRTMGMGVGSTTTGTMTSGGNVAGGAFGGLGSMLGWMMGNGAFGGGASPGGGVSTMPVGPNYRNLLSLVPRVGG